MLVLTLAAIRARLGTAAVVAGLVLVMVAVATVAPWYVSAVRRSVALGQVAAADPGFLAAAATGEVARPPDGGSGAAVLRRVHESGREVLDVSGAEATASLTAQGRVGTGTTSLRTVVAHRDQMCERVLVEGNCPTDESQVMLSRRAADQLGVAIGEAVDFTIAGKQPATLRVSGLYRVTDPLDPYWALSGLAGAGGNEAGSADTVDTLFVAADTVVALPLRAIDVQYHLTLPSEALIGAAGQELAAYLDRQDSVFRDGWRVRSSAGSLVERIDREQRLLDLGVSVAAVQLLLVGWAALFLAVRHTVRPRSADVGLLLLRGGRRWRIWALSIGQNAVPALVGAAAGVVAGGLGAWLVAGRGGTQTSGVLDVSAAAAGVAVAGALAVMVVAERGDGARGVGELLRRVPPRHNAWRTVAVDAGLLVVAGAGLYQAAAGGGAGGSTGLGLLASTLLAVIVALLTARLVEPVAARAARWALRGGRLAVVLGAVQIARRPGTRRVFALLTVAVAVLATAVSGFYTTSVERDRRAAHETGAYQVLTVQARSRAHLLSAVRAADPQGEHAMAVVRTGAGRVGYPALLAVDSPRFQRVVTEQPEYGATVAGDLSTLLRPAAPPPVTVTDGVLTLDVGAVPTPVTVALRLTAPAGETIAVEFPVRPGAGPVRAPVRGCSDGCRLVGFELLEPGSGGSRPAQPGAGALIRGLRGPTGPVLDAALLRDVRRWRGDLSETVTGLSVAAGDAGLAVVVPAAGAGPARPPSTRAYLMDAPVPVPAVRTGLRDVARPGDPRVSLFGTGVPVRYVAVTRALPQVHQGVLVDLEYADRLADGGGLNDVLQVWLDRDAPAGLVDRLRDTGLTILSADTTAAAADRLDSRGAPAASRFHLVGGLLAVLLAAGVLFVAAESERPHRAADLAALRGQGLRRSVPPRAGYGGHLVIVALSTVVGVASAALAEVALPRAVVAFADDGRVLAAPLVPAVPALVVAAIVALLALGPVAAVAGRRLSGADKSAGRVR